MDGSLGNLQHSPERGQHVCQVCLAASGGSGGSGARSIDQLYSFLKNKSDQATMKMDSTAENESKAFFASKNVDIGSLEYSLKTVQASIA